MEVRKGFKQTEVGVIPENWDLSYLGELCLFENGDRGKNYPSRNSFASDGIPFINAGHVDDGQINLREMNYIPRENFDLLRGGKVKSGDVLFCLRGSLGKFGVVGEGFGDGAIASSLVIIRPKPTKLKLNYLTSYLKSKYCVQMIERWAGGAAQPNLGVQDLVRFVIPLPPTLAEQEAIAEALSDADALIESLETLLAKKRQVKQGAMSELLTPPSAAGQAGKRRVVESGEWKVKKIGDIAPLQRGFDLPTSQLEAGNYPVVYSNGILNSHSKYMVKAPGVVTGRSGTIGKVNYVEENFWPHNTTLWVTDFKGNSPKFIYYLYSSVNFERFGTGSGVPTLNRNDVHAFQLPIPPTFAEQTAIAEILSDMDAEIRALEEKLSKARAVKAGMMSELLGGKIRLVESE